MRSVSRLRSWVRSAFHRSTLEREMDDELRFHIDQYVDDLVRTGVPATEARRRAGVEFGGIGARKEDIREALGLRLLDEVTGDVRYAFRQLRRSPAFTAAAVLSLGLGIGANTAIFSLVNGLILRALPVAEPQRLVTLSSGTAVDEIVTFATWDQIRQRIQSFDGAFAWSASQFDLAQGGEKEPVDGVFASGDFFTTLGVAALVGRTFTAADDVRGGGPDGPVAVISYGLWQRRFGGAASVIGARLAVERVPFTIIGVTPADFFGAEVGRTFDVAVPIGTEPLLRGSATVLDNRRAYWLTVMLRRKPDQSLDAATGALRAVQPQIRDGAMPQGAPPGSPQQFLNEPFTLVPSAAGKSELRERYDRPLLTMFVVAALVLLIACANIANLLLARATARRHEVSVRLALGSSRSRLARQLLIESLVLAGVGAAVALVLAVWASHALVAQLAATAGRVALELPLDWRVLLFMAGVTVATAALFGMAPAFRATRVATMDALKARDRNASTGSRLGLSSALVVGQVALSLVLVVAAGLFVGTFQRLLMLPLGFDRDPMLVVNINAARASIAPADRIRFYHRLVEEVAGVPGVQHAAASRVTPVSGFGTNFPVEVSGAPDMPIQQRSVRAHVITPGWLATYGTALRAGRDIDGRDTMAGAPVALVNETFVRRFFSGRNPIGGTFTEAPEPGSKDRPVPKTVVGVVEDAVYRSVREGVQPTVYSPLAQFEPAVPLTTINISVRASAGSPLLLARSIAVALTTVDRNLAFSFRPLADQVNASLAQERLLAMLSGSFGALALLLAGLGLYGVTAYAMARRQTEIGIRMALGATRTSVMRLVLSRVAVLVGAGVAIGAVLSAWASRFVETLLYQLEPRDSATFLGAAALLVSVGLLAGWLPARRASRLEPMVALRHE